MELLKGDSEEGLPESLASGDLPLGSTDGSYFDMF